MGNEIVLRLEGEAGRIDAGTLSEALSLLKDAANAIAGHDVPLPVTGMELGSAVVTVRADGDAVPLAHGLRALSEGSLESPASLPTEWNPEVTASLSRLAALGNAQGVEGISLSGTGYLLKIDDETVARARFSVAVDQPLPSESLGTVRGRLCTYSAVPDRPKYVSVKIGSRPGMVRCMLDNEEAAKAARALIEQQVYLTGRLRRSPEDNRIVSMRVRSIERAPDLGPVPQASELAGLWRDVDIHGKDSVAIVRELRDAG